MHESLAAKGEDSLDDIVACLHLWGKGRNTHGHCFAKPHTLL